MAKIYPYSQYVRKVICTDCGCITEKNINYKPPKNNCFWKCNECGSSNTIVSYKEKKR